MSSLKELTLTAFLARLLLCIRSYCNSLFMIADTYPNLQSVVSLKEKTLLSEICLKLLSIYIEAYDDKLRSMKRISLIFQLIDVRFFFKTNTFVSRSENLEKQSPILFWQEHMTFTSYINIIN